MSPSIRRLVNEIDRKRREDTHRTVASRVYRRCNHCFGSGLDPDPQTPGEPCVICWGKGCRGADYKRFPRLDIIRAKGGWS